MWVNGTIRGRRSIERLPDGTKANRRTDSSLSPSGEGRISTDLDSIGLFPESSCCCGPWGAATWTVHTGDARMATNFWPWIIGLAAAYPLAWEALQINGRPVDVVASDLLILLILLVPMGGSLRIPAGVSLKRLATVRVAAVVFMLYALGLAFTVYGGTADMSRIVSASKLTKPIFFVLLGTYIARTVPPLIALKRVGTAFALIVFATIGSAVLSPGFPRTAFGANLFGTRLYGYPNSAMSFYAVMLPLLIASADTKSRGMRRWFYYGAIGFTALIVVSSLSR